MLHDHKPELLVDETNLPATAFALRDQLAASKYLFVRGIPITLSPRSPTGVPAVTPLSRSRVLIEAHKVCRPVMRSKKNEIKPVKLPYAVADMYLALYNEWGLPPLAGISTSPLLEFDGTVRDSEGYAPDRQLWCSNIPALSLQRRPTDGDADAALRKLRHSFRTFPFADAVRKSDGSPTVEVVDLDQPPALDESAFLMALLTATCRSSLTLAPGLVLRAPLISGAGTGKGLLVRAISAIAFGINSEPFTAGENRNELDKRLVATLVRAVPVVFLDNFNGRMLKSDLLAQVLTEGPVVISRQLGATCMLPLRSNAFIAVTGNGVTIAEDLARRFIVCELDAHCEDPEQRDFPEGFLADILHRRSELLTAALTIWRWGRQNTAKLKAGRPFGSFEQWAAWVRDPLLSLGVRDPVERINAIKASDPDRRKIAEFFDTWLTHHGEGPVAAADLAEPVRKIIDPQGHGRQFVAAELARLANTRLGGFVLTQQKPSGKCGRATYAVQRI